MRSSHAAALSLAFALAGPLVVALRRDVVALIIAHIVTNLYGIVIAPCVGGNVIT
jgi:hypothetical protein